MNVGILGMGAYLPPDVRKNDWWPDAVVEQWSRKATARVVRAESAAESAASASERAILKAMADIAADPFRGSRERRVMPEGMISSDMEQRAALEAMERAGVKTDEIDLLLTHTQVPDYLAVPTSPGLHLKLGLPSACLSINTDSACNSFITQLSLAVGMISAGRAKKALLVQSSARQHLIAREEPHSAWFGDAATAAVVGPVEAGYGLLGESHRTDGSLYGALVLGCPGDKWYAGKPTFYVADGNAARTMLLRVSDMGAEVAHEALSRAGVSRDQVSFYASHQSTSWFRRVTQEAIGIGQAKHVDSFAWTGSLGPSNIPFLLSAGEREGMLKGGDVAAVFSGGSGVTWSSLVIRWGRGG